MVKAYLISGQISPAFISLEDKPDSGLLLYHQADLADIWLHEPLYPPHED